MLKNIGFIILIAISLCGYSSSFAGYAEQVLADAPVAWWRLDEVKYKDGLPAADKMGNVTCAIFDGDAMTITAGMDDKCGWFNGNLAGIDLGNALGPLLNGSSAITVEAWIRNSCLAGVSTHFRNPNQRRQSWY